MASSWTDEANATAKQYAEALKKQSQYLIDQQNQAKQNTLDALENQRTNSINNLNASKDTINQTALDNAKQANINRMLSLKDNNSAMNRAGLSSQGVVGSQVNSINNNYGTNLNEILKNKANQLQDVDNQINSTNLQYDTNRINSINEYDGNIASLQNQIDQQALSQYNTIYQQILAQKQQEWQNQQAEAERQEAIRQFNEQMAYQKARDAESDRQAWAKINTSNYGSFSGSDNSKKVKTSYYEGNINPDTQYGTFGTLDKNGVKYQPNNVGGVKLSNSGYKMSDLFDTGNIGSTGVNVDNQKVWKTANGKYYVWDGSQNKYIDLDGYFSISNNGRVLTSPTGIVLTR